MRFLSVLVATAFLLSTGCGDADQVSAPSLLPTQAPRPTATHRVRANLETGWWAEQGSNGVTSWDCSLPMPGWGDGAGAVPSLAQVLAADNSANVYVISLGAEDGIKKGDRFDVLRDGVRIGALEITDVQTKQAACIRSGAGTTPIDTGDNVIPAAK